MQIKHLIGWFAAAAVAVCLGANLRQQRDANG